MNRKWIAYSSARGPNRLLFDFAIFWAILLVLQLQAYGSATQLNDKSQADRTLASALRSLPGSSTLIITTCGDTLTSGELQEPGRLSDLLRSFHLAAAKFGRVTALGPGTIDEVSYPSGGPNIFKDLSGSDALLLLLSRLDVDQIRQLTSQRGLGSAELRTDADRELFGAIVAPNGVARAMPTSGDTNDSLDLTAHLPGARLRLAKVDRVFLKTADGRGLAGPLIPGEYSLVRPVRDKLEDDYGARVKTVVANHLKTGELDLEAPPLAMPIPTGSLGSVEKLIESVGRATGLEMYVDPHYGNRTINHVGAPDTVRAGDLLKAVCFSLGGTFRKVGSAYVLTNDKKGLGAKQEAWSRFESTAHTRQQESIRDAIAGSARKLSALELGSFDPGDNLAPPTQGVSTPTPFGLGRLDVNESDLSGPLLVAASKAARILNPEDPSAPLSRGVVLISMPQLQVLVPGVRAPVTVPGVADFLTAAIHGESNPATPHPSNNGSVGVTSLPHRSIAIVEEAKVSNEVVSDFRKAGFSGLALEVSPGRTAGQHLKDIAKATRDAGMQVILVASPFLGSAQLEDQDLSILGEPVRQTESSGVFLAPGPALSRRAQSLASLSRLAAPLDGLWLENTAPPGYGPFATYPTSKPCLGYCLELRLTFLRMHGADPLDLRPPSAATMRADAFPDHWEDFDGRVDHELLSTWTQFRREANVRSISSFAAAARAAVPGLAIYVRQRRAPIGGDWYGEWPVANPLPGDLLKGESLVAAPTMPIGQWARQYSPGVVAYVSARDCGTAKDIFEAIGHSQALHADATAIDFRAAGQRATILSELRKQNVLDVNAVLR